MIEEKNLLLEDKKNLIIENSNLRKKLQNSKKKINLITRESDLESKKITTISWRVFYVPFGEKTLFSACIDTNCFYKNSYVNGKHILEFLREKKIVVVCPLRDFNELDGGNHFSYWKRKGYSNSESGAMKDCSWKTLGLKIHLT